MPTQAEEWMVTVATRLGELRERVVFLGGAVLGLLVDTPAGVRHTDDVDVVIDVRSHGDRVALDQQLLALHDPAVRFGFRAAAAVILEDDPAVLRWLKPERGRRIFHIYLTSGEAYYPDFAVETAAEKLVIEVKRADQLDLPLVQEKARAAVEWCGHATAHELKHGGKPWRYVLIPHDAITSQMTMGALVARYGRT